MRRPGTRLAPRPRSTSLEPVLSCRLLRDCFSALVLVVSLRGPCITFLPAPLRWRPMTDTEVASSGPGKPLPGSLHGPARPSARNRSLRGRIPPRMPTDGVWGWAGPLLVTALAAYLRFDRLRIPRSIVFDETYYVKDAFGILNYGVEHNLVSDNTDAMVAHGQTHIFSGGGEFVVHPPLGKMMIAAGEGIFGLTPFGWRFAAAVVGSLAVLMLARIARRLTRSTLLGCLVVDRDVTRAKLAASVGEPADGPGPGLGVRWWRVLAGVCLGLACASKWDGIWYVVAFAALCVAWDIGARRATGFRQYGRGAITDAGWLVVSMAVVPLTTYIVSWSGWFASNLGWDRNYAAQHGVKTPVISALYSLWEYHREMWHFHVTLHAHHPYQSQPWTWLVMSRPVAFYYTSPSAGHGGCHVAHCSQEVLAIGTPAIWWASIAALTALAVWWLVHRDWRAGAVLIGVAAGWLPWFAFPDRTKIFFYAVSFEPYLILAITLCLGLIIGSARSSPLRRGVGAAVVGGYLLVVVLNFFYLYPILAAKVIPYSGWHARMWFARWI